MILERLPKNLNGFTLKIICNSVENIKFEIKSFFNGNIILTGVVNSGTITLINIDRCKIENLQCKKLNTENCNYVELLDDKSKINTINATNTNFYFGINDNTNKIITGTDSEFINCTLAIHGKFTSNFKNFKIVYNSHIYAQAKDNKNVILSTDISNTTGTNFLINHTHSGPASKEETIPFFRPDSKASSYLLSITTGYTATNNIPKRKITTQQL